MQPVPASPARGGLSPTTSPSLETGESNPFTDSAEEPQLRESDNTTVNAKPLDALLPVNLMQPAGESSSPLPNGDGAADSGGDLTPVPRTGQEYWYSNEGRLCEPCLCLCAAQTSELTGPRTIDITLLHEIISTAEALLISLPERERLPTTALFSAADSVLPRRGFLSEDVPHIARLLFRIGGTRGQESLLDKFRTVLAEMGIELVYTDDSLTSDDLLNLEDLPNGDDLSSLGDGATPRASAPQRGLNDSITMDLTPPAPPPPKTNSRSPMHYAPHRRRNSDSIALAFGNNGNDLASTNGAVGPRLTRAHSTEGIASSEVQKKEVRFSDVIDSQSASDITWEDATGASVYENIPFRPSTDAPGNAPNGSNGSAEPRSAQKDDDGRPSTRAENRPPLDFSRFGQLGSQFGSQPPGLPNGEVLSDEEFSSISVDMGGIGDAEDNGDESDEPSLPRHPSRREDRPAVQDSGSLGPEYDLHYDGYSPQRLPFRDAKDESEMDEDQLDFIASAEQGFLMSSFDHWREISRYATAYNIRVQSHAESWDRLETMGLALETWIETAITMHADENQGIQAYQQHVRQREGAERDVAEPGAENAPSATPPVLAESSVTPHVRRSIERSRESVSSVPRSTPVRSTEGLPRQLSQSVERTLIEDLPYRPGPGRRSVDSQARRLQSFGSNWEPGVEPEPVESLQEVSEDGFAEADEGEDAIRTQYQIAAAAWDFFLMSKAFSHWANRADEEVERTQVARRHILRKRCFNAWLGQEERDETESESKAVWFGQMVVLRQWRDVAVATRNLNGLLQKIAERKERRDLARRLLADWYQASKLRLAETIDSRRLQTACLEHWHAEEQWLHSAHEEAEGIFKGTLLGRYMRHWKGEARIQERAEEGAVPIIARRDEFLRSGLALAWRHEAEGSKNHEKEAALRELGDLAKHWVYETRLIEWQEEQDAETLDSLTYHWYCEWRLTLAKRVIEQQETARFLEKWDGATRASAARNYHLRQLARDVRHHDSITGFFNSALGSLEHLEMQAYHARGLIVQRAVPRVVKSWTGQLGQRQRMQHWSQLANFFSTCEAALPHWQEVRRKEWKKRMMKRYHDFRYRVRTETIAEYIEGWRRGTTRSITKGWEADNMHVEDNEDLVTGVTDAWRRKLERVTFSNEVAEDADKETHLIQWHSLLEVHEENRLDAAEFDYAQTAGAYWDEWTLASVAQRGREQTVHEFTGHNARRDQRHFFGVWASQTSNVGDRVPEMLDFRATRRSTRWTTPAPQRTRLTTDYTPFRTPARPTFRQSSTTPAYRPPSEMTFGEEEDD